jgi:CheY-like chemotaxis protein
VVQQPIKVLVVDDNEEVLKTITTYLEQKNYSVTSVSNGLDALKLCESEKGNFDLLITDLVMPSISGVAVISIVKERYPELPIIAITGKEIIISLSAKDLICSGITDQHVIST